jgi:excisionase family DNA binding protein
MPAHRNHKRPNNDASSPLVVRKQSRVLSEERRSMAPGINPPQRFLTLKEIADQLDVSIRTVSRWIATGALVAHKLGRLVRVGEHDLRAFLGTRRGF